MTTAAVRGRAATRRGGAAPAAAAEAAAAARRCRPTGHVVACRGLTAVCGSRQLRVVVLAISHFYCQYAGLIVYHGAVCIIFRRQMDWGYEFMVRKVFEF